MARGRVITPGSKLGRELGFNSQSFTKESWLWLRGSTIRVAAVEARQKGRGVFSSLLQRIEAQGFKVQIMNPCSDVLAIAARKGFTLKTKRITDRDGSRITVDVLEK